MSINAAHVSSAKFAADPEPVLRDLHRKHPPIIQMKMPFFGKVWVPTRHSICSEILRNKEDFVREAKNADARELAILRFLPNGARVLYDNLVNKDDPEHQRLRSLVDQAFMRRNIESMRSQIETVVDAQLDQLSGTCDLSAGLSQPLPVFVIGNMLGMDKSQTQRILAMTAHLRSDTTKWQLLKGMFRMGALYREMGTIVDAIKQNPNEGLISGLWMAEESGAGLSRDEVINMVFALFFAGHETTVHLINGLVLSLIENPIEREKLNEKPSLGGSMVDEGLRFFSPVTFTKPFYAARKQQIRGVKIYKGNYVMPFVIGANRDPRIFDNAHQFQIDRQDNRHLSFSAGPHFCLGARLAKMEAEIAVMKLFERFPQLELGCPRHDLKWRSRLGLRAMKALPVKLG